MSTILLIAAGVGNIIATGFGVRDVLYSTFRPQRMTRFIFLLLTCIYMVSLYAQQEWVSMWFAVILTIGNAIMFALSLKYGSGGTKRSDLVVLILAFLAITIWSITQNPTLGLYLALSADICGYIPTFIKSWHQPQTESPRFYAILVFSALCSLLAVQNIALNSLALPLYILGANLAVLFLITTRGLRGKQNKVAVEAIQ